MKTSIKRRVTGSVLAFVGFMLSPLSWWNDLFVNVPLALAFAWIVSLANERAFQASFVVGYWLTNVLGFVLMHKGGQKMIAKEEKKYFPGLTPDEQEMLIELAKRIYEPDDGTCLEELAAAAFVLGRGY